MDKATRDAYSRGLLRLWADKLNEADAIPIVLVSIRRQASKTGLVLSIPEDLTPEETIALLISAAEQLTRGDVG